MKNNDFHLPILDSNIIMFEKITLQFTDLLVNNNNL